MVINMNNNVICAATPFTPAQAGYEGERLEILNNHFQEMIDKKEIITGSYCLSHNNMVFADNALGRLCYSEEDPRPFQPDTIFRIASITKLFTAVAILKLAEDGKLRIDQSVGEIIEAFNTPPYNEIQIKHLLTHTSGIQADGGVYQNKYYSHWWNSVDTNNRESVFSAILERGLRNKPGVEWSYSTTGYIILGEIISRISGEFCHDYIEKNIIEPCEMTDSCFGMKPEFYDRYYIRTEHFEEYLDGLKNNSIDEDDPDLKIPETGGGIYSTCNDLIKFGTMLLNNGTYKGKRIIGRAAIEKMRSIHTPETVKDFCWGNKGIYHPYGLGPDVFSATNNSQLITPGTISHEGAGTSCLMIDFEENFVAAWSAQFYEGHWYMHALRNVASIIWSGII